MLVTIFGILPPMPPTRWSRGMYWPSIVASPRDQHITTASPLSGDRPSRLTTSSLVSVPFTTLEQNGIDPVAYKGSETSNARTADRKLGFTNKRSEAWWKLREALDPSRAGGSGIELPDDQELLSDLTSVRFSAVQHRGVMCIKAETKEEVVKRLGRSPDKGDAVVMCWSRGDATMLGHYIPRDQRVGPGGRAPKTITSRDKGRQRRKRR